MRHSSHPSAFIGHPSHAASVFFSLLTCCRSRACLLFHSFVENFDSTSIQKLFKLFRTCEQEY
eukprot:COSAG06_NODE_23112_length_702_cov_0.991708_1_plen_62_part_10